MHCGQLHPGAWSADVRIGTKLSSVRLPTEELVTLVFTKAVLGAVKPDTDDPASPARNKVIAVVENCISTCII